MKKYQTTVALLMAVLIFLLCGCSGTPEDSGTSSLASSATASSAVELDEPISLGQALVITDILPYTGAYMEDGTNEVVSGVLMVILRNDSQKALQYAQITLQYGTRQARFSVSNLAAGQSVVLLEQNRMAYVSDLPDSTELSDVVFLPELEMYEDRFAVTGSKGTLTIRNISGTAVSGDIYIYYKNQSQDLLYGGITYRVRVNGLGADETKTVIASHYHPDASVIVMLSCTP